jgi:hypothetical protein
LAQDHEIHEDPRRRRNLRRKHNSHWEEHLEVPDLSCGTYSLPAGGSDPQSPHTEDELYILTRGRAA